MSSLREVDCWSKTNIQFAPRSIEERRNLTQHGCRKGKIVHLFGLSFYVMLFPHVLFRFITLEITCIEEEAP